MDSTSDIFKLIPEYLKAVALIIAGIWAYWKFIYQRENEPAANIDIDVRFIGTQHDQWIIEVTSFVENKSLVKHSYKDFQVTIRYLLPEDKIEDSSDERVKWQLNCYRTIDERINKEKRFFDNVDYINPKQEFKHRYVTFIPVKATFIWIQCKFDFEKKKISGKVKKKMSSQKIFHVPPAS